MPKNKSNYKTEVDVELKQTTDAKDIESVGDIIETTKAKPKQKYIIITDKKANCRFSPNRISRITCTPKRGQELKLYREINGQAIVNSSVWYHVEGGYIHSSQAKVVEK